MKRMRSPRSAAPSDWKPTSEAPPSPAIAIAVTLRPTRSYWRLTPASIAAVLVSSGWKTGTLVPVVPLKPTEPIPGTQPGGAASGVGADAAQRVAHQQLGVAALAASQAGANRSSQLPTSL